MFKFVVRRVNGEGAKNINESIKRISKKIVKCLDEKLAKHTPHLSLSLPFGQQALVERHHVPQPNGYQAVQIV